MNDKEIKCQKCGEILVKYSADSNIKLNLGNCKCITCGYQRKKGEKK